MHPDVHSSTIYNNQDMEATQVSMDRRLDRRCGVCVYIYIYIYTMELYLAIKKNEILPFSAR